jgi:hypothetical protein
VRDEKTTIIKDVAGSAALNPASIASASIDPDDAPAGVKMIIVMISPPIRRLAVTTAAEVTPVSFRLPRQEGAEVGVLQGELQLFYIAIPPSLCAEKLG